jgi:hypothetical protein
LTSVLSVITSAMRLSMKRKIYQPHFTLSVHGIFSMCQAIGGSSRSTEFKPAIELGIDAILMNGPIPILPETVLLCTLLFHKPQNRILGTVVKLLPCDHEIMGQVLEQPIVEMQGKTVHKTQSGQTLPQTLRKQELRAPGYPLLSSITVYTVLFHIDFLSP